MHCSFPFCDLVVGMLRVTLLCDLRELAFEFFESGAQDKHLTCSQTTTENQARVPQWNNPRPQTHVIQIASEETLHDSVRIRPVGHELGQAKKLTRQTSSQKARKTQK